MRVTIFGASGKVGRQAVEDVLLKNADQNLELVLIGRNTDKIAGLVADIDSAVPMLPASTRWSHAAPKIEISADPAAVAGSDLVVIASGLWPTAEEKAEFAKADPSGRLVQSYANLEHVQGIAKEIALLAPQAQVLVVTNQSDLMAEAVREILPRNQVIGFGGMLDSARYRAVAAKELKLSPGTESRVHMVGYHNADMIPLSSTQLLPMDNKTAESILAQTRTYGATVSRLQKDFNLPQVDTGAAVGPGRAVAAVILAFTDQADNVRDSFNIALPYNLARHYGVKEGSSLSVPVTISRGKFVPAPGYDVTPEETAHLRAAQGRLEAQYAQLTKGNQPRPAVTSASQPRPA